VLEPFASFATLALHFKWKRASLGGARALFSSQRQRNKTGSYLARRLMRYASLRRKWRPFDAPFLSSSSLSLSLVFFPSFPLSFFLPTSRQSPLLFFPFPRRGPGARREGRQELHNDLTAKAPLEGAARLLKARRESAFAPGDTGATRG
jgi:hypothetical protein